MGNYPGYLGVRGLQVMPGYCHPVPLRATQGKCIHDVELFLELYLASFCVIVLYAEEISWIKYTCPTTFLRSKRPDPPLNTGKKLHDKLPT